MFPIVGMEAYYRHNRQDKSKETKENYHLCLYATSLKGWHNLLRIASIANDETENGGGFYAYPTVDLPLLHEYRDGVVCSTACFRSWLAHEILHGNEITANDYVTALLNVFGDKLYIEIQPHDFDDQRKLNLGLVRIAEERSVPLIATNDAHFPYKEWASTQQVAKIMGMNKTWSQIREEGKAGKAGYLSELTPHLYLCSEEEMKRWFAEYHPGISRKVVDEAIGNTNLIPERSQIYYLNKSPKFPHIHDNQDKSEKQLREWINEGFSRVRDTYPSAHWERYPFDDYLERVEYEYKVLKERGVIDYFLILGDVCRWAESQGIRVGIARGSAAGSLVSYLIGITKIDPIPYKLLFERFLNPARKGLPDIDVDFDADRRDEVKGYVIEKYGRERVADIITYQRFQPKKVILDLCRTYGIDYQYTRQVTDTIEISQSDEETTLVEILPGNPVLQEFAKKNPELWRHALRLDQSLANSGKHAAGIIITPEPIKEYMALERSKDGGVVTSWSDAADFMAVSDHGFLKYDFLSLKSLSKHEYACKLAKQRTGDEVDLYSLPVLRNPYMSEPEVMQLFSEGYTVGIFQFNSASMTRLIRDIQPNSIFDLEAANALHRPGPMSAGLTWDYAERKNNAAKRTYWAPELKPILEDSYGLLCYQEQVMRIAQELGGMSGADADDLRKAMGKLYRIKGGQEAKQVMQKFEEQWWRGTAERNIPRETAERIWNSILEFSHYAFNAAHSASYSLLAYQDAWLKVHYPAEFYAAYLAYESDADKCKTAMREAKILGIEFKMPDINRSGMRTTVTGPKEVTFGLLSITKVATRTAKMIIDNRPYTSFENFVQKISPGFSAFKELIEAGIFDEFDERDFLLTRYRKPGKNPDAEWHVWEHIRHNKKLKKPRELDEKSRLRKPSMNHLKRLQAESLGIPMSFLEMDDDTLNLLQDNIDDIGKAEVGDVLRIGGEITNVTIKHTKGNKRYANVAIMYGQESWHLRLWSGVLEQYEELLKRGNIVMVRGVKDEWKGNVTIRVIRMDLPEQIKEHSRR